MRKRSAALSLAAVIFLVTAAVAQETADPAASDASADLLLMREKATSDPSLSQQLWLIEQRFGRGNADRAPDQLRQYMYGNVGGTIITLDDPVRIATIEQLQPAQSRAWAAQQILAADLDGDWQITRDELTESLKYLRTDAAAAAFLTGDSDSNNVLTTEEIKSAVDTLAKSKFGQGQQVRSLMPVFDFDSDGYLSKAEFYRGVAALVQQAAE